MRRVALPGQVSGLATLATAGPVFATSYDGDNLDRIAPRGFSIGDQGLRRLQDKRYDRAGEVIRCWDSHATFLVDRHGNISGAESENVLPSRSMFRGLGADGSLRDGPPLSGYHTAYPALDRDGPRCSRGTGGCWPSTRASVRTNCSRCPTSAGG